MNGYRHVFISWIPPEILQIGGVFCGMLGLYSFHQMRGGDIVNQTGIGHFIALKRKEKNLTQAQLDERLGISNKTVSKWENGGSLR